MIGRAMNKFLSNRNLLVVQKCSFSLLPKQKTLPSLPTIPANRYFVSFENKNPKSQNQNKPQQKQQINLENISFAECVQKVQSFQYQSQQQAVAYMRRYAKFIQNNEANEGGIQLNVTMLLQLIDMQCNKGDRAKVMDYVKLTSKMIIQDYEKNKNNSLFQSFTQNLCFYCQQLGLLDQLDYVITQTLKKLKQWNMKQNWQYSRLMYNKIHICAMKNMMNQQYQFIKEYIEVLQNKKQTSLQIYILKAAIENKLKKSAQCNQTLDKIEDIMKDIKSVSNDQIKYLQQSRTKKIGQFEQQNQAKKRIVKVFDEIAKVQIKDKKQK